MKKISLILLALLMVLSCALVASACGSSEETSTSATEAVTTSAAPQTTAAAPQTTTSSEAAATTVVDKKYKIGITQIVTHRALDTNRKGFIDKMTELGYVEGKNIEYLISIPEGDMTLAASIAKKFVADKVDAIFALTTPCAQACSEAVKGSNIPIVYCAVTDPVAAGLVDSLEKSGGNIAGMSDWSDIKTQMLLIKEILPDLTTLGIIYNAGEVNSVVQAKEVKALSTELGYRVEEATSATSADVLAAIQSLVGRCDAVWFPTDNVVASAIEVVIKTCEDNKLPLFGSDTAHVESGALATIGIDLYKLGQNAAIIMDKALKGADLSTFPVGRLEANQIWLNMGAAERMGVTFPQAVIDKAANIIK
ncbi:MAG: ABC transporter substrate-binding protein [Actinomycetia bacterium]|nr:ABC transporter substrate-binding protein [Actinomycetes bacterium]